MSTHAINCEIFSDRLQAYLEHEIDDGARAALERHALSCDDCGALLADLRKLRVDAANMPELRPSRDLWSGIAARIEAPVVPISPSQGITVHRHRRWLNASAIAASLVVAAGIGYSIASTTRMPGPSMQIARVDSPAVADRPDSGRRGATTSPQIVGADVIATQPPGTKTLLPTAPAPRPDSVNAVAPTAQLALASLTADYDREVARLRRLIDERRNQLDPVTVAIVEKNLQVIDTAIAECQRAIARDPASRFLIEALNQSFQTKLELLRTAAVLPPRT